jgi:hypothetical protein
MPPSLGYVMETASSYANKKKNLSAYSIIRAVVSSDVTRLMTVLLRPS